MLQLDPGGCIVVANDAAADIFEHRRLAGLDWYDGLVAPPDRANERDLYRRLITDEGPLARSVRVRTAGGKPRTLIVRSSLLRDAEGVPCGSLNAAEDVTEHQPSQKVLQDTRDALEAYQFALDASAIVAITDQRGIIQHVNEQFCAVSKYQSDELIGLDHRVLNSGYHSRDFFKELWSRIGRGLVWRGDIRNRAKDGTYYWVATTIVPFLDKSGKPKQYVAIRFEITERKLAETALERTVRDLAMAREAEARRAEALRDARDSLEAANRRIREEQAKLIQAEKLSSIGMLASGVAHEINNPLAGVMNCVKALSDGRAKASRRDEYFRTALDGLERIQQIVHGLLDYARQRPLSYSTVDAEEVIVACTRLLAPYLRKNQVELRPEFRPAQLRADRSRIMQALINVLLNAIYVSPRNSEVVVSIVRAHPLIGLAVRDHGPGMPDDVLQKACDPFFTTKPEGEGTGLGLAVTASIVRAHGGHVDFEVHGREGADSPWDPKPDALGSADSGTTVTIWLPEEGEQGVIDA